MTNARLYSPEAQPQIDPRVGAALAPRGEHPILNIPFTVVIDGRSYEGTGISMVGAHATGLVTHQLEGERRLATLQFAFVGFNINLVVDTAIRDVHPETGALTLMFLEPTGPHLPQLRYILNSYIAGDLVGVDSVIAVAGEPADALGGKKASAGKTRSIGRFFGQILRIGATAVLTVALVGFVSTKIYERFFILPIGGLSIVSKEGTTLRAISSGQLDFVSTTAKKGQPAFAIHTLSGDVLTIQMPCDCDVVPGQAKVGDTMIAGDPVMQVAPANAPMIIRTSVVPDTLRALVAGAIAEVHFPDGSTTDAKLDPKSMQSSPLSIGGAQGVEIALTPMGNVPAGTLGTPVSVSVLTNPLAGFGGFSQALSDLALSFRGISR
jgi:alginate biosynthesis protein Alg44